MIKLNSMNLKKIVKIGILFIIFGSIVYWIYKNPELILTEKTQNQLIETAEKIDESFWTWAIK